MIRSENAGAAGILEAVVGKLADPVEAAGGQLEFRVGDLAQLGDHVLVFEAAFEDQAAFHLFEIDRIRSDAGAADQLNFSRFFVDRFDRPAERGVVHLFAR